MQPLRIGKDGVPVIIFSRREGDGRVSAIVGHGAGALVGAGLQEVEADTALFAAHDVAAVHPQRANRIDARVAEHVGRQRRDVARAPAEELHRGRHAGFSARVCHLELVGLPQPLEARRRETPHDLAEGDDHILGAGCRWSWVGEVVT